MVKQPFFSKSSAPVRDPERALQHLSPVLIYMGLLSCGFKDETMEQTSRNISVSAFKNRNLSYISFLKEAPSARAPPCGRVLLLHVYIPKV